MAYNLTAAENATNPLLLYKAVNTASENLLSYGFVLGVFIIILMIMLRQNPPQESFLGASVTAATLSLFLMAADVLPIVWFVGFVLIAAMSAVSLYVNK